MKNIILDVNVILDMWLERGEYWLVDDLLEEKKSGNVIFWCVAGSLPIIEYIFIRYLKKDGATASEASVLSKKMFVLLFNNVNILSNVGCEQHLAVEQSHDLEDAQIAFAVNSLHGEKRIVTNDSCFDTLGLVKTCPVREALAWLQGSSQKALNFIDLKTQQDLIRPALEEEFYSVIKHGRYILGPEVQELEQKLADFVGVKHCIGVSSGTDALLMGLMAQGIGPGDAVFTTPFTFIATAEVVSLLGATPVFVDIDPQTYNIDPTKLKLAIQAVENNDSSLYPIPHSAPLIPKAIIPVDLFGLPADYDTIMAIAKEHDLFVLEDAAQGLGGIYKGRQVGSLAHMGTTSFFPAKPLGCYGDGGAVFTDDDTLADTVRSIRVHGKGTDKYDNIRIGVNARLHTVQAAILIPKLQIFPNEIVERQRVAKQYTKGFKDTSLVTPFVPDALQSVWAQYSLISDERELIQNHLKSLGIPTAVYYGKSLHLQPAYRDLHYKIGDMSNSERISQRIFSLPMHPYLKNDEIEQIIQGVLEALA